MFLDKITMLFKPKPEIEVMFSSEYPELHQKSVSDLLEKSFKLTKSNRVSIMKDDSVWIILTLTFAGTSFTVFIHEFLKESGKLLAQKLFQSGRQDAEPGKQVNYRIELVNTGQQNITINGHNVDDIHEKLIDLTRQQNG